MNREDRRNLIKNGASKNTVNNLDAYQSPCTILEATQIARGVAEDVLNEYAENIGHLQVSMTLQIEMLKKIIVSNGLATEEELKEMYIKEVQSFNDMQKKIRGGILEDDSTEGTDNPKMDIKINNIEVVKEG